MRYHLPRIVITAPRSGSGKTLLTCGILSAFYQRKNAPTAFKCGPDYIDPMFHESVLHTKSKNLDPYFIGQRLMQQLFTEDAKEDGIAVIEGVMGYYDGIGGDSTSSSTYEVAGFLNAPAILVVDASGSSVSLCALIKGFLEYRTPSNIEGVILNRISAGLYPRIKVLIEEELGIRVCGYLPKLSGVELKSRHLGLVLPDELPGLKQMISGLGEQCQKTLDMDLLLQIGEGAPKIQCEKLSIVPVAGAGPCPVLAVARDEAFSFYYKDNLRLLEKLGAELVPFSPLHDKQLPQGVNGLWLGGGYPELHAEELSHNKTMRDSIRRALEAGLPCIAECGGFLYLQETLTTKEGVTWDMVGFLKGNSYFAGTLSRFGYIELTAQTDQMLVKTGDVIRGHEFHYMDTDNCGTAFLAEKPQSLRKWNCGHGTACFYGGFPHLYLYSNVEAAVRFVKKMKEAGQ